MKTIVFKRRGFQLRAFTNKRVVVGPGVTPEQAARSTEPGDTVNYLSRDGLHLFASMAIGRAGLRVFVAPPIRIPEPGPAHVQVDPEQIISVLGREPVESVL